MKKRLLQEDIATWRGYRYTKIFLVCSLLKTFLENYWIIFDCMTPAGGKSATPWLVVSDLTTQVMTYTFVGLTLDYIRNSLHDSRLKQLPLNRGFILGVLTGTFYTFRQKYIWFYSTPVCGIQPLENETLAHMGLMLGQIFTTVPLFIGNYTSYFLIKGLYQSLAKGKDPLTKTHSTLQGLRGAILTYASSSQDIEVKWQGYRNTIIFLSFSLLKTFLENYWILFRCMIPEGGDGIRPWLVISDLVLQIIFYGLMGLTLDYTRSCLSEHRLQKMPLNLGTSLGIMCGMLYIARQKYEWFYSTPVCGAESMKNETWLHIALMLGQITATSPSFVGISRSFFLAKSIYGLLAKGKNLLTAENSYSSLENGSMPQPVS